MQSSNLVFWISGFIFCGVIVIIIESNKNEAPVHHSESSFDSYCSDLPALSDYETNIEHFHECGIHDVYSTQTDTHGQVFYARSKSQGSWEEGKQFCEERGLKMARIYNTRENEAIYDMYLRVGQPEFHYSINIGGKLLENVPSGISKEQHKE